MSKNISLLITELTKKYGINYQSKNPEYIQLCKDTHRMQEICRSLREMMGDLSEIEDRHDLNGLGKLLADDVKKMEVLLHDLTKISTHIKVKENETSKN